MSFGFKVFKSAALLTLSVFSLTAAPGRAADTGFYQGAECSGGRSEFYKDHQERGWSFDRAGSVWRGDNVGDNSRCGLITQMGLGEHVLLKDKLNELVFVKIPEAYRKNITVRFIFAPHPTQPDERVVVEKPLTDFAFRKFPIAKLPWVVAEISSSSIWGNNTGNANLVKIVLIMKGKAEAELRNVDFRFQINSKPDTVNLKSAPCEALDVDK